MNGDSESSTESDVAKSPVAYSSDLQEGESMILVDHFPGEEDDTELLFLLTPKRVVKEIKEAKEQKGKHAKREKGTAIR